MLRSHLIGGSIVSLLTCLALACGTAVHRAGIPSDSDAGTTENLPSLANDGGGVDGEGGVACAAVAAETKRAKVDIIFVIDDSGSMREELAQVRLNVNDFASKIGGIGLDYTVTFIVNRGNDAYSICVPPPLASSNCGDNPPVFHHVNWDVQSTNSFQQILRTYDSEWGKYVRFDATKVFVEVTDDGSDMEYTDFDEQLLAKPPLGMFGTAAQRKYVFHSIVSKPFADSIPSTSRCSTADGPSVDYQMLSQMTGGIVDEVCKTDYSGVLDNIAKGITDRLGCELTYPSSDASDPSKLAVTFTPKDQPTQTLTQVTDVAKCATIANAWYYDDPAKPTKILLCPSTCSMVNAAAGGKVDAMVGCKGAPPS